MGQMGHIFLVGFMGSGKSTIGRNLSRLLDRELFDTDAAIVKKDGRPISRIFKESGEGYFRRLETLILTEIEDSKPLVVSCGGGMAIRQENVDIMKRLGKVVLLSASPQTILERVKRSDKRPILEGNKNIEFITNLMEKRIPYYEKASDIKIDCNDRTVEDISLEIKDLLTWNI